MVFKLTKHDKCDNIEHTFWRIYMNINGIWVNYDLSKKQDMFVLNRSLKEYGFKWGHKFRHVNKDLRSKPKKSIIYVYYTLINDKYSNPRVLIKIDDNNIDYIIGREKDSEIEYEFVDTINEKLNKIKNLNKDDILTAKKQLYELKIMNSIIKKIQNNEVLTDNDIKNLYVYNDFIKNNNKVDERILKIKKNRNIVEDYNKITNTIEKIKFFEKNKIMFPHNVIDDKDVILNNAKKNKNILLYATKELKKDKDFILQLIKINPDIFENIDSKLKRNISFITNSVMINAKILKYVPKDILLDRKLLLKLIKINEDVMCYIDYSLYKDISFIKEVIKIDDSLSRFADNKLLEDEEIALAYIKYSKKTNWLDSSLRKNPNFILEAIKYDPNIILLVDKSLIDDEFLLKCINNNLGVIYYIEDYLTNDFIYKIIEMNHYSIYYLYKHIYNNRDLLPKILDIFSNKNGKSKEIEEFDNEVIKSMNLVLTKKFDKNDK